VVDFLSPFGKKLKETLITVPDISSLAILLVHCQGWRLSSSRHWQCLIYWQHLL